VPVLQRACTARWSHSFYQQHISILHVPSARRSIQNKKKYPGNILISVLQMNSEPCIEIKKSLVGIFKKMMLLF